MKSTNFETIAIRQHIVNSPKEERLNVSITDGLVRISVGLEHINDIINDLNSALSAQNSTLKI